MEATAEEQILCTDKQAQHILQLCERTLLDLRKSGELPFVPIGRAIRYRRVDLLAFAEKRVTRATA